MDAAAHCETAPTLDLLAKGHVAPRIGTPGNMELDELENMAKSDFLPLLPLIKQEHLDNAETATTANPCDSVEKQVDETTTPGEPISTKCVWCMQVLTANDRPKLLECLHVACSQCVTTKFSELDRTMPPLIHCPVCNMASQNEFIIDNHFLMEQSNANEEGQGSTDGDPKTNSTIVKCSSCSDDANATSWCVDCSEYICDNCVQAHQRLKITKDHTIKPKEEATTDSQNGSNTNKNLLCSVHTQEKLSLFCETCDKLTCRDCQLVDHRDHKYKFAHEIATETRTSLSSLLSEINYKRFLLVSARKVIDDRQNLIADKKKELIREITNMVVKITNTVNHRGKQLAMRLNEVCDSKLKVLNEKKDALQLLSENTDHCIDFVQAALDKGSDCAILYSKKSLARHLQKLKCQRADIPNPEIPVRIQVQLNQVPELQKVISQLGTIIVDGKPYPPPPASNGPPRQQPSPNMAPPLRPGLPPPGMAQISPGGPSGFQNGPPIYNSPSPQQQFNNMQINRPFGQEVPTAVRFTNMGPVGMQRQGQPHVSSSTHPQNMDISLRGLLNNQNAPPPNQGHINFNGPPNYPGNGPQNGPPHQNMPPQMRPHYMAGPPAQQHQNFQQQQPGPNPQNFINNGPRFQNFQRMTTHPPNMGQQQGATNTASGGGGGGPPPGQMRPIMQNNMGYPGPQTYQQAPANNQQMPINMHAVAKWHIPQSAQQANGQQQGPLMQFPNGRPGENFKINLKSPTTLQKSTTPNGQSSGGSVVLPNVTSTNPKTPSPSTNDTSKDFTEPIDKVRDDSINDLMATIAKLDSNGVQVLPEGRNKTTSPQVHSSTDIANIADADKTDQKDDPNEDWCAVCLDGGELMCCDKCPKVFHQNCHIPAISSLPDESETWQCLLCVNLADLANTVDFDKRNGELGPSELKIIQRICLELYCQYEQSLPFREPEPATHTAYYEIICHPMSLDVIRTRLDPSSPNHYKDIATFVADVRLLFKNVYLYFQEDSKTYSHARYLEQFFEEQLGKWLPKYAVVNKPEGDEDECPAKRTRKESE
ncbi:unnamed protein product [Hermetia illucens]|uniref:E3 ubiquitin-protein ligase TRIM33 n=1 Tax=Hermetia illucens TaxID=343691 RepID=A0A7R8V5D5_HERIL|nr:unnamed protein product [Hermetia illucens]